MSPLTYAIGLTTTMVFSLVLIGWVAHVIFRVPRPLWTFAMIATAIVGLSAAIVGYRQWLNTQHKGAGLRWDGKTFAVTIPLAILIGGIAWLTVRGLWDGPVIGEVIVFVSFFVTTLLVGCMISMRAMAGPSSCRHDNVP